MKPAATFTASETTFATPEEGRKGEVKQGGFSSAPLKKRLGWRRPPLFGLRGLPVELAGLRGVFVARLRRGNFYFFTSYVFLDARFQF